jgi:hypothetical protein
MDRKNKFERRREVFSRSEALGIISVLSGHSVDGLGVDEEGVGSISGGKPSDSVGRYPVVVLRPEVEVADGVPSEWRLHRSEEFARRHYRDNLIGDIGCSLSSEDGGMYVDGMGDEDLCRILAKVADRRRLTPWLVVKSRSKNGYDPVREGEMREMSFWEAYRHACGKDPEDHEWECLLTDLAEQSGVNSEHLADGILGEKGLDWFARNIWNALGTLTTPEGYFVELRRR